jgi:hypothetical protein
VRAAARALLLAACAAAAAAPAAADELRAGLGVAALPAEPGGGLGGYGGLRARRARETLDPPEARALVIERGSHRVVLLAADVLIARRELSAALDGQRAEQELDALALVATHTHSGPGGYVPGWLSGRVTGAPYDPARARALGAALALAVERGVAALAPARLGSGWTELELARNRRRKDGPRETRLWTARIETPRARIALLAYGAHPTVLSAGSRAYSADFPGVARAELARHGWQAVFLPGPLGDQAPAPPPGSPPPQAAGERAALAATGGALGAAALAALEKLETSGGAQLDSVEREVAAPPLQLRRWCGLWWLRPWIAGALAGALPERVRLQALRLGQARVLALPAEPTSEVARALRERTGDESLVVVSHANEWLGYALLAQDYARGGYEACMSFHGAELADWLIEQAAQTLALLDSPP